LLFIAVDPFHGWDASRVGERGGNGNGRGGRFPLDFAGPLMRQSAATISVGCAILFFQGDIAWETYLDIA
jgi:hypothetical protein